MIGTVTDALPPICRYKDVAARLGIHRTTLHEWVRSGYFPKPAPLGPHFVAWPRQQVEDWLAERGLA